MSYILDALRRSESERHGDGPGGHTPPPPVRPRRPAVTPVLAATAAGIVALAIAAYLATRPTPAPVPPVTGPVGESLLADAAVDGRVAGDSAADAAATPAPVPRTVAAGERVERRAGKDPDTGTGTDNHGGPAETTDAVATPPAVDGGSGPVTPWGQLPLTYRAQVPTFAINVHVYAPEPARRFVMVDMKRYREGDTLPVGPRVESITSDGLVLAWRGRRFLWPVDGPPR